jgi:hypothetical protein
MIASRDERQNGLPKETLHSLELERFGKFGTGSGHSKYLIGPGKLQFMPPKSGLHSGTGHL